MIVTNVCHSHAQVIVQPETAEGGPCVLITCLSARVEGDWAESNGLNDRFEFSGVTRLQWGGRDGDGSAIVSVNGARRDN